MRLIALRLLINKVGGDLYFSFKSFISFSNHTASLKALLLDINSALSELCAINRCCYTIYSITLFTLIAAHP